MPVFSFEALAANGQTQTGVLEADSARAARTQLRTQALVPIRVEPVAAAPAQGGGTRWGQRRALNTAALTLWTRQLAGLVAAGLPLERALANLADEAERPQERALVSVLRAEVNGGSPFARALAQHGDIFPPMYVAVVGAGEQSGQLGTVLERLADDLEAQQALRAKLLGAALYPAIVSLVAVVIVLFLLTYVVPQVANVFASSKRALPTLTVVMLAISSAVRQWGWVALIALFITAIGVRIAWARDSFRLKVDAAWLRLPILGRLSRSYNAARFGSTLALLAQAGVPILRALQTAAETLSNRALRADALDALVLVREGAPLAVALAQKKRFPPLLAMFARLGEQTGQLPTMLQRAASQLGSEVQRRAMQLATLLEPLLIVAMGALVMLIVLAVLMPIIQLNQLVR